MIKELSKKNKNNNNLFLSRLKDPNKPVLIFDGATGTSLQQLDLTYKDFGSEELEGCNEILVETNPEVVKQIHKQFLESGCDVIETNTFGATSIVLSEYNIQEKSYQLNKKAAELAKEAANEYSTLDRQRFVAGSIGPTTKLPTLGHVSFEAMKASYIEQVEGLIDGGVDLLLLETCQDVLQIKSGLQSIEEVFNKKDIRLPIMVSVTIETTGTMLVGTDIATVLNILEPFDIDILGLNCATGPHQMKEHIKYLCENSTFYTSCIPNAGLPENVGGNAVYKLTPIELKMQLMHFICDLGVRIIGGCCGTTPEHIKLLSEIVIEIDNNVYDYKFKQPNKTILERSSSSIYSSTPYNQDNSFLIIGERLNASGSKKVRELLNEEDWDGLVSLAKSQIKENAHMIDVNVDYVGRDGVNDMNNLAKRLATDLNLPLMLDSTEYEKMESGLKVAGGKSILNSTNYEDGDERFFKVLDLAKRYGSGVVIGLIDESGMARSADKKFEIALRAYQDAIDFGISPEEIFYDPLALPISTGIEEDRRNAIETIEAIKLISNKLIGSHIILGVSNISFGLSVPARITLNSVFLHECCKFGMDAAIISPSKILPLSKIDSTKKKVCLDLINDNRRFDNDICTYDPLTQLTKLFEGVSSSSAKENDLANLDIPIEEKLKRHIIDGEKLGLNTSIDNALKKYQPLQIINTYLLDGMRTVGELFGSGQMQLPFVLQSAETMKSAVSYLEPFMETIEGNISSKAKFLIATVKGDVHDIGKNLVDIILTNNGYEVINLGIKQDINNIISAQLKYKADCIAMSGLLVKSTAFMKNNLSALNEAGITVPVILGGAALTPKFVNVDCNQVYNGKVIYGKDAFTDLKFMDDLVKFKKENQWSDLTGFKSEEYNIKHSINTTIEKSNNNNSLNKVTKNNLSTDFSDDQHRSPQIKEESMIEPPFIGTKIIRENHIQISEIVNYLDKKALFAGQWQMKRLRSQSLEEYSELIDTKAEPVLKYWLARIEENKLVTPKAIYGYFPVSRKGNSLQIYDSSTSNILTNFDFPRQKSGKKFCIADYYRDEVNGRYTDYIPMQAVTMGDKASQFSINLFNENKYSDYLYFHGLAVQLAEAMAEAIHARIRKECNFLLEEPTDIKDILNQKYRGCRFSFGYPACPNVSDSRKQLKLLGTNRIGLSIDESDQLHPEQSTTALIALHSEARYFSV